MNNMNQAGQATTQAAQTKISAKQILTALLGKTPKEESPQKSNIFTPASTEQMLGITARGTGILKLVKDLKGLDNEGCIGVIRKELVLRGYTPEAIILFLSQIPQVVLLPHYQVTLLLPSPQ